MVASFTVRQTTDSFDVEEVTEGSYTEPRIEADKVPDCRLTVKNNAGIPAYTLAPGKEFLIKRSGVDQFPAIVTTNTGMQSGKQSPTFTVEGIHKGYHLLKSVPCSSYDFDEDGQAVTTRDAVTVNPWRFFVFRDRKGVLDARGEYPAVDGLTFDEAVKCVLGTRFIHQHRFDDNHFILASSLTVPPSTASTGGEALPVNLSDYSGNGYHLKKGTAAATQSATAASTKYGLGIRQPSGVNYQLQAQQLAWPPKNISDLSIAMAFKIDSIPANKMGLVQRVGLDDSVSSGFMNYELNVQATNGKLLYQHGNASSGFTAETAATIGTGAHTLTLRRDATARTVVVKVDGVEVINTSYTAGQAPTSHPTLDNGKLWVAGRNNLSQPLLGDMYELRIWNSLVAQATLDLVANPADATYKLVPQGTETALYWFATNNAKSVPVSGRAQVYRDSGRLDTYAVLQHSKDGSSGTQLTCTIPSIALQNGDRNIKPMGIISAATVRILGRRTGTPTDLTLKLCRNALTAGGAHVPDASRTYTSVTLARADSYLGTALSSWTGTITFSGSETVKNAGAWQIVIPGNALEANRLNVEYIRVDFTTAADTGLTAGTITAYTDPLSALDIDFVETNLLNKNRLEAAELLRRLTESTAASNPSPHWDFWIDSNLAAHFTARRGTDIDRTYSFAEGNLRQISHEYYGHELAYQTVAYGPGSEESQTRIVSKQAFSAGGLYDADRDPTVGGLLYGNLPRVMDFVDANEKSPVALLRKARAFHKLHRTPQERITVEIHAEALPFFTTGDAVDIKNMQTKTNVTPRVVELTRSWSGAGEKVRLVMGENMLDLADRLREASSNIDVSTMRQQPSNAAVGLSGNGVTFDKDHYGAFSFGVPEGAPVERCKVKITGLPWQSNSRAAAAAQSTQTRSSSVFAMSINRSLNGATGGGFQFNAPIPQPAGIGSGATFKGTFISFSVTNRTKTSQTYVVELHFVSTAGPLIWSGSLVTPIGRTSVVSVTVGIDGGLEFAPGTDVFAYITGGVMGSTDNSGILATAILNVDGLYDHVHPQDFGPFLFNGDGAQDNTLQAVYCDNISFAVDPTVNSANMPTNYEAERNPLRFGSTASSETVELDITNFIATDANGVVKPGEHRIYFLGNAGSLNSKGLGNVSVTPILIFKGAPTK